MIRLRKSVKYPIIARVLNLHIIFQGLLYYQAPKRTYDSVATYVRIGNAEEMEKFKECLPEGATASFFEGEFSSVQNPYFDFRLVMKNTVLEEEIGAPADKNPAKVLVIGEHHYPAATVFLNGHQRRIETWGFSENPDGRYDHWTPGPDKEDEDDVNTNKGFGYSNFPSKNSVVHDATGAPECFDIVVLGNNNWWNRTHYIRDHFDWAEEKLRPGGIFVFESSAYTIKSMLRIIVSRFESIGLDNCYHPDAGHFGPAKQVTLFAIKKTKRSRDDSVLELLEKSLTAIEGTTIPTLSPWPPINVYPPSSTRIYTEKKVYVDDHLLELEEVEAMLSPEPGSYGIDTYHLRQKVKGITECRMAIGTSYSYMLKCQGEALPGLREYCEEHGLRLRAKGEKSHVERNMHTEPRDTTLSSELKPVVLSKETDFRYMSLFCCESPLRLHSNLLQKKTEKETLVLPVPPKITNLTKLTQHLCGVVQGPDEHWLATKGTVETVKSFCTTESDDGTMTIHTTKKRVKQVGIFLDGPNKGALIEVEAA